MGELRGARAQSIRQAVQRPGPFRRRRGGRPTYNPTDGGLASMLLGEVHSGAVMLGHMGASKR